MNRNASDFARHMIYLLYNMAKQSLQFVFTTVIARVGDQGRTWPSVIASGLRVLRDGKYLANHSLLA